MEPQKDDAIFGTVTAIRKANRSVTFVDVKLVPPHQTIGVLHGIHVENYVPVDLHIIDSNQLNQLSPERNRIQAKLLCKQSGEAHQQSQHLGFVVWKQLLVGSTWLMTGMLVESPSTQQYLLANKMFLCKCRLDPAPLERLLDVAMQDQIAKEMVAQAILEAADHEAMEKLESLHEKFVEAQINSQEEKKRYLSQLSRYLSTGMWRCQRKRNTHIPIWVHNLISCDTAQQLLSKYPLHHYESNDLHAHLEDTIINNCEGIEHTDGATRLQYLHNKKRPQVAMMLAMIGRTLSMCYNCADVDIDMELFDQLRDYPFVCVDIGGGRGDLALNIANTFHRAQVFVCDINLQSLQSGQASAAAVMDSSVAERIHFKHFAAQNLLEESGRALLEEIQSAQNDLQGFTTDTNKCHVPVLIVGLHACGGLSDMAIQLSAHQQWPCICCTCCFASNAHLRWSQLAQVDYNDNDSNIDHVPASTVNTSNILPELFMQLAPFAECNGADIQSVIMHLLNSIRVETFHAEAKSPDSFNISSNMQQLVETYVNLKRKSTIELPSTVSSLSNDDTPQRIVHKRLWQFPNTWSSRNLLIQVTFD